MFQPPAVNADTTLTFEVTATDSAGTSVTKARTPLSFALRVTDGVSSVTQRILKT